MAKLASVRKLYDPQEDTETVLHAPKFYSDTIRKLYDPQEDTETSSLKMCAGRIVAASSTIRKRILKPCNNDIDMYAAYGAASSTIRKRILKHAPR